MKKYLVLWSVLMWCCSMSVVGAEQAVNTTTESLTPGMVNPGFEEKPDWFKNSFLDIRDDVADATDQQHRVLLYFYQDGCPYCAKLLRENFAIKSIVDKTRKNFDVIAINMWGDREVTNFDGQLVSEKQFAKDLRVMFTPTLLFLDEAGKVVIRVNGYYPPHKFTTALDFVAGQHEKTMRYRDFYVSHAEVATGELHHQSDFVKPPYRLSSDVASSRTFRPLLVLFEQKQCEPCDELHTDVLKRPESIELMKKFDVVLLDMWSKESIQRPDGVTSTARQWASDLDIKYAPSMVFFDASGSEVFRTEAWLKAFHLQSSMDYVITGAYRKEPEFQRYIAKRAEKLEAQGIHVDIMH